MVQQDKLVVVDIEATCWKNNPPLGEQNEIIEIGVCLLNLQTLERSDKRSILVKPSRSKVSKFCTELTSLTQEQVDTGITYAEACEILQNEFDAPNRLWGSWGDYDRKMFVQQCDSFFVPYPFSDKHVNLKALFTEKLALKKQVGMAGAIKMTGLPLEGTHHRGDDDAWNIARLTAYVLEKQSADVLLPYF